VKNKGKSCIITRLGPDIYLNMHVILCKLCIYTIPYILQCIFSVTAFLTQVHIQFVKFVTLLFSSSFNVSNGVTITYTKNVKHGHS